MKIKRDLEAEPILRRPEEWEKITGWEVLDADGWRSPQIGLDPKAWDEPISEWEFYSRLQWSTIRGVRNDK